MGKTELTMVARVRRALLDGPARGQYELGRRVLGKDYDLSDWRNFVDALNWHLAAPASIIEERHQLPGTGHEAPPVYEYTYRLATKADAEKAMGVKEQEQ